MAAGVVPLAITIGVMLATSPLTTIQALASGPTILAGTSQLAALQFLATDVAPHMIVLSAITLNLRILLYGAAFAPWFEREPLTTRMLLAIPIVDQPPLELATTVVMAGIAARSRCRSTRDGVQHRDRSHRDRR